MTNDWLAWVEACLGEKNLELRLLTPDASHRRYYRVTNANQKSLGVLCVEEPFNPEDHSFLNLQRVWSQAGIRVPEILNINARLGLILQSDLGDLSLQSYLSGSVDSWSLGPAKIPSISLDNRRRVTELIISDIVKIQKLERHHFKLNFDKSKFGFEWGWTWQHLVEPNLSDCEIKNFITDWQKETLSISSLLEDHIEVPTHRDLHSRNIMIVDGFPFYIDFQDGRLGTHYYDLISLLFDSYLPFDSQFESEMREMFCSLSNVSFNYVIYYLQAIQRTLKACGSFASFKRLKSDERYQGYIRPTLIMTKYALNCLQNTCAFPGIMGIVDLLLERDLNG